MIHSSGIVGVLMAGVGVLIAGVAFIVLYRTSRKKLHTAAAQEASLSFVISMAFSTGLIGFIILIFLIAAYNAVRIAPELKSLKPYLDEYIVISGYEESKLAPYIRGKIIIVDKDRTDIDRAHKWLPNDLRAASADEVKTVVLLEREREQLYAYGTRDVLNHYGWMPTAKGYIRTCKLTIIDKTIPAIVYVQTFKGSKPPDWTTRSKDKYGSDPTKDVVKFLKEFPRKP